MLIPIWVLCRIRFWREWGWWVIVSVNGCGIFFVGHFFHEQISKDNSPNEKIINRGKLPKLVPYPCTEFKR